MWISPPSREDRHRSWLDFLGYTNQATFLLNCGLTDVVASDPGDRCGTLPAARQRQYTS